jgi:hypothetical protein
MRSNRKRSTSSKPNPVPRERMCRSSSCCSRACPARGHRRPEASVSPPEYRNRPVCRVFASEPNIPRISSWIWKAIPSGRCVPAQSISQRPRIPCQYRSPIWIGRSMVYRAVLLVYILKISASVASRSVLHVNILRLPDNGIRHYRLKTGERLKNPCPRKRRAKDNVIAHRGQAGLRRSTRSNSRNARHRDRGKYFRPNSAYRRWSVGSPCRKSSRSMISSCTRRKVWSSSIDTAVSRIASSSVPPPARYP